MRLANRVGCAYGVVENPGADNDRKPRRGALPFLRANSQVARIALVPRWLA